MILIDAGVLIAHLRRPMPQMFRVLGREPIGILGVTRAEVIHGCKSDQDLALTVAVLDRFEHVLTPETAWDSLGRNLRALRQRGYPMPLADVLFATVAMESGAAVWTLDSHFQLIREVFPNLELVAAE